MYVGLFCCCLVDGRRWNYEERTNAETKSEAPNCLPGM